MEAKNSLDWVHELRQFVRYELSVIHSPWPYGRHSDKEGQGYFLFGHNHKTYRVIVEEVD